VTAVLGAGGRLPLVEKNNGRRRAGWFDLGDTPEPQTNFAMDVVAGSRSVVRNGCHE
jgi:hypothetical protein